jgi:HupE / UreJ protein
LSGVLFKIGINAYIIDTIIGFSIVYKALDNMGAYKRWFGFQPDPKKATFIFGLFHGFGLATKILDYELAPDGLFFNLIFFNVGVEIGQILALGVILIAISYWRKSKSFLRHAYNANVFLMMLGFLLMGFQMTGYFTS